MIYKAITGIGWGNIYQIQKPEYKRKSLSESIPRGILYLYQHIGRERDGRDDP